MSNAFWVYENWKTNGHRARIHESTCKHCGIDGEEPKKSMEGSAWRGPFESIQQAVSFANQLGAKVTLCRQCMKEK